MAGLKAAFHTLGCKTNHYETDAIRMQFAAAGFTLVDFRDEADVYVVNTCTVTAEADRKSRQMLRRARQLNREALIVAVGCQAVIGDAASWADLVVDNDHKSLTCQMVMEHLDGDALPAEGRADPAAYDELGLVTRQSETRAYLKIEDGCDQFCSYCAIPLARGRVRSREHGQILKEAEALAQAGYQEIVLTGIHICSYGKDLGLPEHALMELAADLAGVEGIARIRLGSLDPGFITPRFVTLAAQNPRLCPHFHLSLQSGSDRILERMKRSYRKETFRQAAAALRQAFSHPGLTTDMIVGFPGETEADFAESLAFCQEMAFSRLHVFRYSPRRGTAAEGFDGIVPPADKARRSQLLSELAMELARRFHQQQVGRTHVVLVEQTLEPGLFSGYTPEYVPVRFTSGLEPETGQLVRVSGVRAETEFLFCAQT